MITLQDAFDRFIADFSTGCQSHESPKTYSQALQRLREYFETYSTIPNADDLTVDHALAFARWLAQEREPHVAKATLNLYLSAIAKFYGWLLRERLIALDASDVQRMRDAYHEYRKGYSRPLPKLPPDEAITTLLAAARDEQVQPSKSKTEERRRTLARLRNIAVLEALRVSGMRIGELVKLKRGDLDYRGKSARVTGKGSKQRVVFLDETAWQAIQDYLRARQDGATGSALYSLPIFAQHGRRAGKQVLPVTTHHLRFVFKAIAKDAGIELPMTPHWMRHWFATRVYEKTDDVLVVASMLGHSSTETTRIYAKVSDKRQREAHRAAFGN